MSETIERVEFLIGGELQPSCTSSYFDDFCPEDGSLWRLAAQANSSDVNKAVINADDAWRQVYSHTAASDRGQWLQNTADIMERDKVQIANQISIENGSPIVKARSEVDASIDYVRGCKAFVSLIGEVEPRAKLANSMLIREQIPIGVCVTITPFNNPLFSAVELSASAMALGNTVVSLSSEFTPNVSFVLAKIYSEAGFPPGTYNQLSGSTEEVAEQLASHPMVQAVLFGGIAAEGAYLSDICSRQMKRILLDLDCTNTTFLMRDADIERAAKAVANNCFFYQGQGSEVTTRVICEKKVFQPFMELLISEAEKIQLKGMGSLDNEETWIGPCISDFYIDHISMQLDDARKKGVRIVCGGQWQGSRLQPTILTDVTPEMSLFRSVAMGPIVSVYPVSNLDEAISMVNDSNSDLSASIWTTKTGKAKEFSQRTTASFVHVNMLPSILEFEGAAFFDETSISSNNAHIYELTERKVTQVYLAD